MDKVADTSICDKCDKGYAFANAKDKTGCAKAVLNCFSYTLSNFKKSSTCAACSNIANGGNPTINYILMSKDKCIIEIPYCSVYEADSTKCKTCKAGYVYTSPADHTGCAKAVNNCYSYTLTNGKKNS